MRDIALRAGCSVSTVSRALRGNPRISREVRGRVGEVAAELGYRCDENASRLMSGFRAKARGEGPAPEVVALIHAQDCRYQTEDRLGFWSALTSAGEALGLEVNEFVLDPDDPGPSGRRLSRVLQHRGIRGAVLFPFYQPDIRRWELDWDAFSLVAVGSSPEHPTIDRVDLSDYEDAMLCLGEIAARGYRRIGLTSSTRSELHTGGVFVAAYHYFMETHPEIESCPVLRLTGRSQSLTPNDRPAFESWFREHRPDAIVTSRHEVREWLAGMGLSVPGDIGLATLWPEKDWAGIAFESSGLMRPALEWLRAKLWSHKTGPGDPAQRLLVRSPWREGETLRRAEG